MSLFGLCSVLLESLLAVQSFELVWDFRSLGHGLCRAYFAWR